MCICVGYMRIHTYTYINLGRICRKKKKTCLHVTLHLNYIAFVLPLSTTCIIPMYVIHYMSFSVILYSILHVYRF